MRIQEVESLVGITKKNIRFYEQEGLIDPKRNRENGYRDYGEEDVQTLKKIRLLRRLGLPIEEIRRLQAGSLTLGDAMGRHEITLQRQTHNLELCAAMCRRLDESALTLERLEPEEFLRQMDALEQEGASFMPHGKTDVKKSMTAPIVCAAVFEAIMIFVICLLIWANSVDPIPTPFLLFLILIPTAVCVGVAIALRSRYQEIKAGELNDADKY
ncbi:MAG: MerR family transcriptional regulator [Oscillospiraceae bacterium]|nr:MerR family transcriptional regulator [Oscillospiraceae bacterium]